MWKLIDSKIIEDQDGDLTNYTWYSGTDEAGFELHIFMFGDFEAVEPDRDYADWECETYEEALQWFEAYMGFADE